MQAASPAQRHRRHCRPHHIRGRPTAVGLYHARLQSPAPSQRPLSAGGNAHGSGSGKAWRMCGHNSGCSSDSLGNDTVCAGKARGASIQPHCARLGPGTRSKTGDRRELIPCACNRCTPFRRGPRITAKFTRTAPGRYLGQRRTRPVGSLVAAAGRRAKGLGHGRRPLDQTRFRGQRPVPGWTAGFRSGPLPVDR